MLILSTKISHLASFSQWFVVSHVEILLKASTGFPDSPIPQAQDSELRHVGDLAAGATSEDDARVGAARHVTCQDVPGSSKLEASNEN